MPSTTETALIVHVKEAEPYVSELRLQFDYTCQDGVPAHVTILYPFVPLELIDTSVLAKLRGLLRRFVAFDYRIKEYGRWADNLHLLPTPAAPFIALTRAIWDEWPECPPYERRFPDIVPHLTVAQGPREVLDDAESLLKLASPQGGFKATCRQIDLIANVSGVWQQIHRFQLGSADTRSLSADRPDGYVS